MATGHSVDVAASAEKVWGIWTDTAHWPDWNPTVKQIGLSGPLAAGATGTMTTDRGGTHQIRIASVDPGRSFRLDAKPIPMTTFHFDCEVHGAPVGCTIRQSVSFSGLGFLLSPLLRRQVAGGFPAILAGLKARAEGPSTPSR
jgi:uncharacterized protein YndB with AHSA1/START domain